MNQSVVFLWDNFGPLHVDRCEEVARFYQGRYTVIGIEFASKSQTYDWAPPKVRSFTKETLFLSNDISQFRLYFAIIKSLLKHRPRAIFFCHYDRYAVLAAAITMRLLRKIVITTNDSKFDDYPRYLWREVVKRLFFLPYQGALVASPRCADYVRFLGVPKDNIELGVYAVSSARIQAQVGENIVPCDFSERHYTIVARLVSKKNLALALEAFSMLSSGAKCRKLVICGSGPLENALRHRATELGISDQVQFRGFVQTADISKIIFRSLAVILPSVEEQFGQVVEEAQALGIPTIVSPRCGAADELVRNGVNGFVCEPDNAAGYAWFMERLAESEPLWNSLSAGALGNKPLYDISRFSAAVDRLMNSRGSHPYSVHGQ